MSKIIEATQLHGLESNYAYLLTPLSSDEFQGSPLNSPHDNGLGDSFYPYNFHEDELQCVTESEASINVTCDTNVEVHALYQWLLEQEREQMAKENETNLLEALQSVDSAECDITSELDSFLSGLFLNDSIASQSPLKDIGGRNPTPTSPATKAPIVDAISYDSIECTEFLEMPLSKISQSKKAIKKPKPPFINLLEHVQSSNKSKIKVNKDAAKSTTRALNTNKYAQKYDCTSQSLSSIDAAYNHIPAMSSKLRDIELVDKPSFSCASPAIKRKVRAKATKISRKKTSSDIKLTKLVDKYSKIKRSPKSNKLRSIQLIDPLPNKSLRSKQKKVSAKNSSMPSDVYNISTIGSLEQTSTTEPNYCQQLERKTTEPSTNTLISPQAMSSEQLFTEHNYCQHPERKISKPSINAPVSSYITTISNYTADETKSQNPVRKVITIEEYHQKQQNMHMRKQSAPNTSTTSSKTIIGLPEAGKNFVEREHPTLFKAPQNDTIRLVEPIVATMDPKKKPNYVLQDIEQSMTGIVPHCSSEMSIDNCNTSACVGSSSTDNRKDPRLSNKIISRPLQTVLKIIPREKWISSESNSCNTSKESFNMSKSRSLHSIPGSKPSTLPLQLQTGNDSLVEIRPEDVTILQKLLDAAKAKKTDTTVSSTMHQNNSTSVGSALTTQSISTTNFIARNSYASNTKKAAPVLSQSSLLHEIIQNLNKNEIVKDHPFMLQSSCNCTVSATSNNSPITSDCGVLSLRIGQTEKSSLQIRKESCDSLCPNATQLPPLCSMQENSHALPVEDFPCNTILSTPHTCYQQKFSTFVLNVNKDLYTASKKSFSTVLTKPFSDTTNLLRHQKLQSIENKTVNMFHDAAFLTKNPCKVQRKEALYSNRNSTDKTALTSREEKSLVKSNTHDENDVKTEVIENYDLNTTVKDVPAVLEMCSGVVNNCYSSSDLKLENTSKIFSPNMTLDENKKLQLSSAFPAFLKAKVGKQAECTNISNMKTIRPDKMPGYENLTALDSEEQEVVVYKPMTLESSKKKAEKIDTEMNTDEREIQEESFQDFDQLTPNVLISDADSSELITIAAIDQIDKQMNNGSLMWSAVSNLGDDHRIGTENIRSCGYNDQDYHFDKLPLYNDHDKVDASIGFPKKTKKQKRKKKKRHKRKSVKSLDEGRIVSSKCTSSWKTQYYNLERSLPSRSQTPDSDSEESTASFRNRVYKCNSTRCDLSSSHSISRSNSTSPGSFRAKQRQRYADGISSNSEHIEKYTAENLDYRISSSKHQRQYSDSSDSDIAYKRKRRREQNDIEDRALNNRTRILHVGEISHSATKADLRKRFEKFGEIENIALHFKFRDNYAFVTFREESSAERAIKHGNEGNAKPLYRLGYGGRRNFCQVQYVDLDMQNRKDGSNPSEEVDFDTLLQQALVRK